MKLCTIGESILRCKPHIPCAPVLNGTVLCRPRLDDGHSNTVATVQVAYYISKRKLQFRLVVNWQLVVHQQQDDPVLLDAAAAPRRHDHVVQLRDQEALVDAAVHPQVQGPLAEVRLHGALGQLVDARQRQVDRHAALAVVPIKREGRDRLVRDRLRERDLLGGGGVRPAACGVRELQERPRVLQGSSLGDLDPLVGLEDAPRRRGVGAGAGPDVRLCSDHVCVLRDVRTSFRPAGVEA